MAGTRAQDGKDAVVVLALDSVDPGLAHRLIAAGHMPNLGGFLTRSAHALVESPPGFAAGATWPSLTTGLQPDRHGFYWDLQVEPGTYEARRRGPADVDGARLWDVLADAGLRCAVFDVPVVAPSTRDVVHLVEYGSHSMFLPLGSTPPSLASEIVRDFGPHPVNPKCDDWAARGETGPLLDALRAGVDAKERIAHAFLDRGPWDLFYFVFSEGHCAGHQLWPVGGAGVGDPVHEIYERLDGALGRLLGRLDPSTTAVVVLSHGMGARHDGDHLLAEILYRLDVSAVGPRRAATWRERAHRRATQRSRRARRARPLRSERCCYKVPTSHLWSGVRVNLRGREPRGVVAPGSEYDAVLADLTEALLALEQPESGAPVVRAVHRVEDFYDGPARARMPDLFVVWHGGAPITAARSERIGTVAGAPLGVRRGDHRAGGLVAVRAPGTVPGPWPDPLRAVDVAPTLASWFGVEMPGVDGRAVEGLRAGVTIPTGARRTGPA